MFYFFETMKIDKTDARLLFDNRTEMPVFLPLIFFIQKNNLRSLSRQTSIISSIKAWYDFWQLKYKRTFCAYFIDSDYNVTKCIEQLPTFLNYLKNGRTFFPNVIEMETANEESTVIFSTLALRMQDISLFLKFLLDRYISTEYSDLAPAPLRTFKLSLQLQIENEIKELTSALKSGVKSPTSGTQNSSNYKSLTAEQLADFVAIIRPSTLKKPNDLNPWQDPDVQFRNYHMFMIQLREGLRIGELLLLEINSARPNLSGESYTLDIREASEDHFNSSYKAKLKNVMANRELNYPANLYRYTRFYIDNIRVKDKKTREKPPHSRLFVARNGQPIHYSTVNDAIKQVYEVLKKHFPHHVDAEKNADALKTLRIHMLRYTWATAEMAKQVCIFHKRNPGSHKGAVDSAKDILRSKGGWSLISEMPSHYAKRYLQNSASSKRLLAYYSNSWKE